MSALLTLKSCLIINVKDSEEILVYHHFYHFSLPGECFYTVEI